MDAKAYNAWMKAGMDMWMLGAETGTVMVLRMARIAAGGSAGTAETTLMVTEKVRAAIELQTRFMTGSLGVTPLEAVQGTVKHYRHKVAANKRRLTSGLIVIAVASAGGSLVAPALAAAQGDRGQAIGPGVEGYIYEVAGHCARHGPPGEVEQMRQLANERGKENDYLLRRLRKGLRQPKSAVWCEVEMKGIR